MRYIWDEQKNIRNIKEHKIAFEDAVKIFEGQTVERLDDRFEYGEVRIYAIGLVSGRVVTVIYTDVDNDDRRIISAWRSEPYERRAYWNAIAS